MALPYSLSLWFDVFCIEVGTNQDLFAAIATVVTVAEILKNNGLAVEKSKNRLLSFYCRLCLIIYLGQHCCHGHCAHLSLCTLNFPLLTLMCVEIRTSTVEINDESRGRPFQKAKVRDNSLAYFFVCQCANSLT